MTYVIGSFFGFMIKCFHDNTVITNLTAPIEMKLPPPPEWANDKITEFIEVTKENSYATFVKCKKEFSALVEIDDLFREAIKAAHNCKPYFAFLFILKSHSAFLGAVKLALGTQIPESHMVIRGALENALYGFYIFKNPDLAEVWLRRDESKEKKNRVRNLFQIKKILESLDKQDSKLGRAARILYERTIDFGAHPNEKSLSSSLKKTDLQGGVRLDLLYLTDNPLPIKLALKTITQVGIASLRLGEIMLPERFKILSITDRLDRVSKHF